MTNLAFLCLRNPTCFRRRTSESRRRRFAARLSRLGNQRAQKSRSRRNRSLVSSARNRLVAVVARRTLPNDAQASHDDQLHALRRLFSDRIVRSSPLVESVPMHSSERRRSRPSDDQSRPTRRTRRLVLRTSLDARRSRRSPVDASLAQRSLRAVRRRGTCRRALARSSASLGRIVVAAAVALRHSVDATRRNRAAHRRAAR